MLVSSAAAVALAVSIGQSGAYFTGTSSTGTQTATAGALPAPASLSVSKTGSTTGQSSAVSWSAPATRPWEAGAGTSGSIEYTVKRNTVDAFGSNSGAVQVYKGTGTSVTDAAGSPPVTLGTQVAGFSDADGTMALVNGVPYRWGRVTKIDWSGDTGQVWAGASGQESFNTGVLTEMQFANSSQKEELTSLAPGQDHACALSVTKRVFCIGFGSVFGQTGQASSASDTTTSSPLQWSLLQDPRGVFVGKSIVQVASGLGFSCALASDGTIGCWGKNGSNQLGNGGYTGSTLAAPIRVAQADGSDWSALSMNKPIMIATGSEHVCAVKGPGPNGEAPASPVACWGSSSSSALGTYSGSSTAEPQDIADPNGVLTGITSIYAGGAGTCVLTDKTATTNVACWGRGPMLGRQSGSAVPANSASPAPIQSSVTGFTNLDMTSAHVCGAAGASVVCWGRNSLGKLGSGSAGDDYFLPAPVVDTDKAFGGAKIVGVGVGRDHSCAVTERGIIACWGDGRKYQLGQGSSATDGNGNTYSVKPVVVLLSGSKMVAAANADLMADGSWGQYAIGRINGLFYNWGHNGSANRQKPNVITGYPANITRISAGSRHACGITGVDDKIYCSGANDSGQLGDGSTVGSFTTAVAVVDPEGVFSNRIVVDVSSSGYGTCALTSDGVIGCWGTSGSGLLTERQSSGYATTPLRIGTGTNGATPYPALTGSAKPLAISGGDSHFCALTAVSVVCWGNNGYGQLGRSTASYKDPVPAAASSNLLSGGVVQIDAGQSNTCAVKTNGTAYCWGAGNRGILGNGSQSDSIAPVQISGSNFRAITIGLVSACATSTQTTAPRCWGSENYGQLGRSTTILTNSSNYATPAQTQDPGGIFASSRIVTLLSLDQSYCALTESGRLSCWGWGAAGSLAQDGNYSNLGVPTVALLEASTPINGAVRYCLDGAAATNSGCTLVPSRTYYYQVTYSVSNVPNWVSARAVASR